MIYTRIELKNFGVHSHLAFEPSPRLTGVVGRNGSGKSTVLAAMELLATGAVPTAGVKDMNINQLAAAGSPSYVAGTIAHGGHVIEVVRGLRKAKSQVTVDGGKPVYGDAKVNQELAEVFGESINLLGDYVFVKQDEIYSFLEATEANRSRAFAQLFGTAHAEKCWDLAGKRLNGLQVPPRSDLLDEARRRRLAAGRDLAELRELKGQYAHVKGYDREADPDVAVVARYRAYKAARKAAKQVTAELADLKASELDAIAAKLDAKLRAKDIRAAAEQAGTNVLEAKVALSSWKAYRRQKRIGDALASRRKALADEKGTRTKPEPPAGYLPSDDAGRQVRVGVLKLSIDRAERFISTFKKNVAVCPTCGTPASTLADAVAAAKLTLPVDRNELFALDNARQLAEHYERELSRYQDWRESYKLRKQALDAEIEAFEDGDEVPDIDEEKAAAAIDTHAELQSALVEAESDLSAAEKKVANVQGRLESARTRLDAALAARKAARVSREDYEAALEALRGKLRDVRDRGVVLGRIKAARASLEALDEDVARLEADEAAAAGVRRLASRLESIRAVLHRGRLPRQVATAYLGLIEGGLNRFLARCDAGFAVASTADLSYDCLFEDGRDQPATRLSGGQKVMLAIGFRVEVNALFASEIGLLCLDEPTRALDRVNIACVEVALARLSALSDATGLQCVLVTHEAKLSRLFDSVVNLQ